MKLFYPLKINVELNGEGHDYNTRNQNNMAVIQHKLQFFFVKSLKIIGARVFDVL